MDSACASMERARVGGAECSFLDKLLPQSMEVREVGVLPDDAKRVISSSWSNGFEIPRGVGTIFDEHGKILTSRKSVGEHATDFMPVGQFQTEPFVFLGMMLKPLMAHPFGKVPAGTTEDGETGQLMTECQTVVLASPSQTCPGLCHHLPVQKCFPACVCCCHPRGC